jgi:hypothetical protein
MKNCCEPLRCHLWRGGIQKHVFLDVHTDVHPKSPLIFVPCSVAPLTAIASAMSGGTGVPASSSSAQAPSSFPILSSCPGAILIRSGLCSVRRQAAGEAPAQFTAGAPAPSKDQWDARPLSQPAHTVSTSHGYTVFLPGEVDRRAVPSRIAYPTVGRMCPCHLRRARA